ncbi:MAG TPA: 3-oxo-tetronate kinase, partial [Ramlibacter sp.]|nr:3-oxo-tetronate kinase [Ramlibacter sp.]
DSTPQGNIGPVAEALLAQLGAASCCVTPAFPQAGRTVYMGHLFVGRVPLHESGMRNHPLTPMTDANLVRVMQAQCEGRVELLDLAVVRAGSEAVRARMAQLQDDGVRFAIVDAAADEDLMVLGRALAGAPLVVAGSGVAIGLAQNHGIVPSQAAAALPPATGTRAIVSGSCSEATNGQVRAFIESGGPAFAIDPLAIAAGSDVVGAALEWAGSRLREGPVLVYSSAPPQAVQSVQGALGVAAAGSMVEDALARVAQGLVERGVRQLVVAGGETSGAVVQALGVGQLRIGAQIDPGVPWCHATARRCGASLHLALKSGNFGAADFFRKAFGQLA